MQSSVGESGVSMPTILVVDDDRAVQQMLVDLLEEHGYAANTCRDGNQVIPQLQKKPCDLVILDVLIPHLNGFVLMEQMRAEPGMEDLPVIMISGIYRSRNHRVEMTTKYKVIDYLDKPLNTDRLLGLIENIVGPGDPEGRALSAEVSDPEAAIAAELQDDARRVIGAGREPVPLDNPKQEPIELDRPKRHAADAIPEERRLSEEDENKMFEESLVDETSFIEEESRASFRTSALLLQGLIKTTPMAQVLGRIWDERASGGLLVRRKKVKKIIHIRNGNPESVKSNLVNECLGQILLRERLITIDECEASITHMKAEGRRQGEVLVAMGCLTANNLAFALELQIETKIFDTFTWAEGEYRFNSSLDMPPVENPPPWTGPALVVEGIRRTFDETRLRKQMLPVLDVPLMFPDDQIDLASLGFSEREQQAIEAIIPPQTTRELIDIMPLDPPDTLRVIYSLIALQILEPAT